MNIPEDFPAKLKKISDDAKEANELQIRFGDHMALAQMATFATAIAICDITLSNAPRRNTLRVSTSNKALKVPLTKRLSKDKAMNGFSSVSRLEPPHVVASIVTDRYKKEFSFIPVAVGNIIVGRERWISKSRLMLESDLDTYGTETFQVGIIATHSSYDVSSASINKIDTSPNTEDFNGLFYFIEDLHVPEETDANNDPYSLRTTTKNPTITITGDPERHFNFHAQLGVNNETMERARRNFNVIMACANAPYRTDV